MAGATTRLHASLDAYQRESGMQTTWMVRLTWVITVLTAIMLLAVVVQIVMAARAA
jgi:hypothetical protein